MATDSDLQPSPAGKRTLARAAWAAFLLLCVLQGMRTARVAAHLQPREITVDEDSLLIVEALERRPRLVDTLAWWTGPWAHRIPYYRPLTSFFFWLELKLFGRRGMAGFTLVHHASHLLVLALALGFLTELAGWRTAALAVGLFAAHANRLLHLPSGIDALYLWKDSCEVWCAAAYLGCVWCFLRFLRRERNRWLVLSLLWFLVALTFKEMAYTAPLVLGLLLWHQGRVRSHARFLVPFLLAAGGALIVRWWALQGWVESLVSNESWWYRLLLNGVGYYPVQALYGDGLPVGMACLLLAAGMGAWRRRWAPAAALALLGVLALAATGRRLEVPLTDLWTPLLVAQTWRRIAGATVFTLLVGLFVRGRHPDPCFGYGWVLLTYLPLNIAPTTEHTLYLVALGWSLWLAHGALQIAAPWLEQRQVSRTARQAPTAGRRTSREACGEKRGVRHPPPCGAGPVNGDGSGPQAADAAE